MSSQPDDDLVLIDRFLAGELGDTDAEAFQRRVAIDTQLAAELALQRNLHTRVAEAVPVPSASLASEQIARAKVAIARGEPTLSHRPWTTPRIVGLLTIAALVLISTVAVRLAWGPIGIPGQRGGAGFDPFAAAERESFRPSIPQEDPAALEVLIAEKLGRRVRLPRAQTTQYLGVRTDTGGSPLALSILARAGDRPVLLVFDRTGTRADEALMRSVPRQGIFRYEKVEAAVVMTEWSELNEPALIRDVRAE